MGTCFLTNLSDNCLHICFPLHCDKHESPLTKRFRRCLYGGFLSRVRVRAQKQWNGTPSIPIHFLITYKLRLYGKNSPDQDHGLLK